MFKTPVLFLIFNRPEITHTVFKEIKKQKPKFLFIAADGPRSNIEGEIEKCKKCREIVLKEIDWDCEVKTLFKDSNLGCGKAVSGAIDWFFENVEMGIILEDDCLPHYSFFNFCETLLEKYKDEKQIYAISGNNFQNGIRRGEASYYFSNYGFVWGWASWRRAWVNYDYNLTKLEVFKKNNLLSRIDKTKIFKDYWLGTYEKVRKREIDTWDYQWLFTIWYNKGIAILPNVNLVSNIGFGKEATHTTSDSFLSKIPTQDIGLISHPKKIEVNKKADRYSSEIIYKIKGDKNILIRKLKRFNPFQK